jgi:hypothetical protein
MFSITEFQATVTLRCPWVERHLLVEEIRGGRPINPADPGAGYENGIPYPDKSNAYYQSSTITPIPASSPSSGVPDITGISKINWDEALVTVTYSTNMARGKYTETIEPTIEMQILDWKLYRWAGGVQLTDPKEAPAKQIRGVMYTVDIMNMPRTSFVAGEYASKVGMVNALCVHLNTFTSNYQPGALLLVAAPVKVKQFIHADFVTTDKAFTWDYSLKYAIKPSYFGWNGFWRQKTNNWEQLYNEAGVVVNPYTPGVIEGFLPGELWTNCTPVAVAAADPLFDPVTGTMKVFPSQPENIKHLLRWASEPHNEQ